MFDHINWYGELSAPCSPGAQVQRLTDLGHLGLGYTTWGAGMSSGEMSGVDLAREALLAAREAAKKNGSAWKEKPRRRGAILVRRDGREALGPRRGDRHDDDQAWHGRPGRRRQRPRPVRRHPRRGRHPNSPVMPTRAV
ncbi:hypothetical protein [Streptomyces sp. NPDC050856]|uniref:hypothetical protein n=1 Tax=Streptomyces sp. NPDC050856 TaxID=3154939 RepID=UPI0033DDFF94